MTPVPSVRPVVRDSDDLLCADCRRTILAGDAHVILHGYSAGRHALYHPKCCPADHTKPAGLSQRLLAEGDTVRGLTPQRKRRITRKAKAS